MLTRFKQLVFLAACLMISSQAAAGLIITEVMFSPTPDPLIPLPPPNEWIELYNNGTTDIDLSNFDLINGAGESFGSMSGILSANEAIVVYDSVFAITSFSPMSGPVYDYSLFATKWGIDESMTLALDLWRPMADGSIDPLTGALIPASTSKTLRLISLGPPLSESVSLVRFDLYGAAGNWPQSVVGHSMYLADLDDPSPSNWLTFDPLNPGSGEVTELGTPGVVEVSTTIASVPEPGSMAIFAGILSFSALRRRRRLSREC